MSVIVEMLVSKVEGGSLRQIGDFIPLTFSEALRAIDAGDARPANWVWLGTKIDAVNDSIMPYALPAKFVQGATPKIEVTTIIELLAAGAGALRNYVTSLVVTNSDPTVGTVVEIRSGTATVIHRGYAAPAGGGWSASFPTPLFGAAATAINVYCMTASAEVYVSCTGFQAADPV